MDNIPLVEIIPYSKNPRKNDKAVDLVVKSIKEFGFINPIILDKNNEIIAGHTRYKAAVKLGLIEVPVIWADTLSEEQVRAYRILDNKSSEIAEWDFELLKGEFHALEGTDCFEFTGFSSDEISKIWDKEIEEDDFNIPKEPKYKVNLGEIYELGEHRLMCGDCTKEEFTNKLFNNQKINQILIDPPYGVDYSEKNKFLNSIGRGNRIQTPIENDKNVDIKQLVGEALIKVPLTEENTIYVFSRGKHIADMIYSFKENGFYYSQDLKWIKNNHVLGRLDYNPKSENIIYGWKGKHKFYGGFQTDILNFDRPTSSKEHPTMKPIKLLCELLKHGSQENAKIYDGFGGSGSTLIACEQTNRKCFMMELDPFYCSVIIERFEKLTGKTGIKQ